MHDPDTPHTYDTIDSAGVGRSISDVPRRCRLARDAGQALALPEPYRRAYRVVVAGMAQAASAGAFIKALHASESPLPISVWRNYDLPAFATGPETLVIAISPSGRPDEPLSALELAAERGCHALAITAGGLMGERARALGIPTAWMESAGPDSLAGLWLAYYLLGVLSELWLIPNPAEDVEEAVELMASMSTALGPNLPAVRNPAKRLAGQFTGRLPVIAGAGLLAPAAAYWKLQLNHLAKTLAVCDEMPEAGHSSLLGYESPAEVWQKAIVVQLRGACDGLRLSARYDATTTLMLEAGLNQDTLRARGRSGLAQLSSLAYFGDWVSYYTAIMGGVDPAPAETLESL